MDQCSSQRVTHSVEIDRGRTYAATRLAILMALVNLHSFLLFGQAQQIRFERVSIEQGLSQSDVNCILQDNEGFMWFGTQDGLNKYDGYTFTVYRHNPSDTSSISDNYITALFVDGKGTLWIGTQKGLNRFNRETENFRPFIHHPNVGGSLSHNFVSSICAGSGTSLLVGTFGEGLKRLETVEGRFYDVGYDSIRSRGVRFDTIRAVYRDRAGIVWVGSQGEGLLGLGDAGEIVSRYRYDPGEEKSLSHNVVQCISEDRRGSLWVGTSHGLNRLNRVTGKFSRYSFGQDPQSVYANYILSIYEDQSGMVWVGTDEGLELYDPLNDRFRHFESRHEDPEMLSDDGIMSVCDAGGVVWFGTKRGLNKHSRFRKQFQTYRHIPDVSESLSDNKVWSIYCDRGGILWVGSNGGLDGIDRASGRYLHYRHDPSDPASLSNNSVMSILEDESGFLWLGTWGGGLDRFDRKSEKFKRFGSATHDSPYSAENTVVSLSEDRNRNLWLATYGGMAVFDLKTEKFRSLHEWPMGISELFHDPVRVIKADKGDRVWLGMTQGLIAVDLNRGAFTSFRHQPDDPATLSDDRVLSLEVSGGANLLVGTEEGLNLFDTSTGSCVRFTASDGLPNDVVCGILEDLRGNLWISTNKGISMLNPGTRRIKSYDIADGLQSNEFNQWASFKSPEGEMFFGGINGLTSFFPDSLRDNPHVPPIVLTALKIKDQRINGGMLPAEPNALEIPYDDNSLSFEFAALDYTKPEKNQYAYMLEGFDESWNYSGTRRYASYTNLDPGKYILRLKGSNNDGIWNERGISLRLSIAPPYWMTWWWRAGAILCLLSITAAGYFSRLKTVRKRNELLEKRIEERTRELGVINANLQTEVLERRRTENELWRLKQRLEKEVLERTAELTNTVSSLEQQVAARERAEENLLAYREKLRSLASDLSATEERERRRLSTYLHDSIGQTLAFCKIKLGSVQRSARLSGSDRRLRELLGMIEQSISDTRRLTLELSPPILHELGLAAAIDWLCSRLEREHEIHFSIQDDPRPGHLDPDLSVLLFHAVREVVVNIVKHSGAKQATIRISRQEESIRVHVEDDGCGFDASALQDHARRHDGFGLFNIRERLHSLGGVLEIASGPGLGTRVLLTVPLYRDSKQHAGPAA